MRIHSTAADQRRARRARRVAIYARGAAAVAALAVALVAPATARTVFPIDGGPGDAGFEDHCPADQYVSGLAGRAGLWIDEIELICAPILASGMHGPSSYGRAHGGTGGAALEFSCPNDAVASGASIGLDDHDERVTQVRLTCTSLRGGGQSTVVFGSGEPASTLRLSETEACPNGELATGFAGRYGKDVNALGLLCDTRETAAATATATAPVPAPAPAIRRETGALRCPTGFVWREASPADHVCVTPPQRATAARENDAAAEHLSATDRTYGSNTCAQGYVWREAYAGDVVCVTPRARTRTADENAAAPPLVPAEAP